MRCALVTGVQTCALPISSQGKPAHGVRSRHAYVPRSAHRARANPRRSASDCATHQEPATSRTVGVAAVLRCLGHARTADHLHAGVDARTAATHRVAAKRRCDPGAACHDVSSFDRCRSAAPSVTTIQTRPTRRGRLADTRSEAHTSELQSLMRLSYAVLRL